MHINALPKLATSIACMLILQACNNTQRPAYPPELQMIIASSAQQAATQKNNGQDDSQAVTVDQLLESVRREKEQAKLTNANNKALPDQPLAPWIFTGDPETQPRPQQRPLQKKQKKDQLSQAKPVTTSQRQLQLSYQTDAMLPNKTQLMMAKQILEKQNMQLIELMIGSSSGKTPMNSAANAQKRAKHLLKELSPANNANVQYQPRLGNDIVVVTFAPRGR